MKNFALKIKNRINNLTWGEVVRSLVFLSLIYGLVMWLIFKEQAYNYCDYEAIKWVSFLVVIQNLIAAFKSK